MEIYNNIDKIRKKNLFVTTGVFDGLHLGHQHIISELIKTAKEHNVESAVITFFPHPLTIVSRNIRVLLIDTLNEKIQLLEKTGIDNLIIIPFTKEFATLKSKEFMQTYLKDKLDIKGLIVGYDHKFGRDKLQDFDILSQYAECLDFEIRKTSAFKFNNETISSTLIRRAILEGQIRRANAFLSRHFQLSGEVIEGKKIGRQIGFPTANIKVDEQNKIIPKKGVYAVKVQFNKLILNGMLNIGTRPTFNDNVHTKNIEVYIFDFKSNLYGKKLTISFHKRIRNEVKFAKVTKLIEQLKIDEMKIRKYFQHQKEMNKLQLHEF